MPLPEGHISQALDRLRELRESFWHKRVHIQPEAHDQRNCIQ